jgi:hypothetical protein
MRSRIVPLLAAVAAASTLVACGMMGGKNDMTFFVSSTGGGKGADLGGLVGADALCNRLAAAAGSTGHDWRAYLSTVPVGGSGGVNARDRIGPGPWRNAKGVVIAQNVTELHGANNLNKNTALTEKGDIVNGRGDTPNQHDILTGSQPDGTAIAGAVDSTCRNWTWSAEGAAMVGHHDRTGLDDSVPAKSWNSSHQSRGCSQDALRATGGDARIYCFARN